MIRLIALLVWCLLGAAAHAQPPQAAAVGYNTRTFASTFVPATVDVGNTHASGFAWYIGNFFNAPPTSPIMFNGDGSATVNGSNGNAQLQISTAALVNSGTGAAPWVGTAFGGGAYFEATFKFTPSAGDFAFWSMAIEHLSGLAGQQWSGQAAGYTHYAEYDFFEYFGGTNPNYFSTMGDWYGTITCTGSFFCGAAGPAKLTTTRIVQTTHDYSVYHTYGALWVPATVSTNGNGYIKTYLDNEEIGIQVLWTQLTTQAPPPPNNAWPVYPQSAAASFAYGIIDQQHMVIILGSGAGQPMTFQSVNVWQNSSAGNLVQ